MVQPHEAKSEREGKKLSLYWVHSISSLPATPTQSNFACDITGNWVQYPFWCDFRSEIGFAFVLVWLDHNTS